ncbi:hypothetical protein HDU85_007222 [Gaertneriomyces sp. JEL0708]|nr:hypothetical protein HDU85_007222 [Gaertneriomyces sp. JEL0708]
MTATTHTNTPPSGKDSSSSPTPHPSPSNAGPPPTAGASSSSTLSSSAQLGQKPLDHLKGTSHSSTPTSNEDHETTRPLKQEAGLVRQPNHHDNRQPQLLAQSHQQQARHPQHPHSQQGLPPQGQQGYAWPGGPPPEHSPAPYPHPYMRGYPQQPPIPHMHGGYPMPMHPSPIQPPMHPGYMANHHPMYVQVHSPQLPPQQLSSHHQQQQPQQIRHPSSQQQATPPLQPNLTNPNPNPLKRDASAASLSETADIDGADDDDDDNDEITKEGKGRQGRRKIKIEYIDDKSRRHITFSKRKAGIMKKAYELSTLTGTQVLLLVASETGHVYTFATPKLQPLITKPQGKNLIQECLNAPDHHVTYFGYGGHAGFDSMGMGVGMSPSMGSGMSMAGMSPMGGPVVHHMHMPPPSHGQQTQNATGSTGTSSAGTGQEGEFPQPSPGLGTPRNGGGAGGYGMGHPHAPTQHGQGQGQGQGMGYLGMAYGMPPPPPPPLSGAHGGSHGQGGSAYWSPYMGVGAPSNPHTNPSTNTPPGGAANGSHGQTYPSSQSAPQPMNQNQNLGEKEVGGSKKNEENGLSRGEKDKETRSGAAAQDEEVSDRNSEEGKDENV